MDVVRATSAATTASVHKQHDRAGSLWQSQRPIEHYWTGRNANQTLFNGFAVLIIARPYTANGNVSGTSPASLRDGFERLDRPCLVKMQHGIELVMQLRLEIVTLTFSLETADHANRSLEPKRSQIRQRVVTLTPAEQVNR
jgi:hypothetical protein